MKKKDKEKILDYIDRLSSSLVWCFNEEWTSKYMNHFIDMKKESMLYNNEFVKMHLSILEENGINDTTEGFDEEHKKIETELCNFFTTNFKKSLKEKLPKHFEELRKQKKEEKASCVSNVLNYLRLTRPAGRIIFAPKRTSPAIYL